MKLPIPNILNATVMREPCGDIYLSRIMEHAGLFGLLRFFIVVGAVCLAFKLRGFNCKLHTFFRGDEDRELHDHPWPFWSLVIMGGYHEEIPPDQFETGMNFKREAAAPFHPEANAQGHQFVWRGIGELDFRPAKWRHRVVLPQKEGERPKLAVTLVFTKKKEREWGFWTRQGWVPWFRFIKDREDAAEC